MNKNSLTLHRFIEKLLRFDLFGVRPSIYFKGRKKAGTRFGLCLTFFFLIFTSLCFAFFGSDLYYRLNPQIRYHESYNPFPEEIVLDPELSPIVIELNSPNVDEFYTNSSLINMNVTQFTIKQTKGDPIFRKEQYKMEICRKDHFEKLDEKTKLYFWSLNLNDYFCIPKEIKNLTMIGSFDQPIFKMIEFTASICNNFTTGGKCLPIEEIKTKMASGYLGIYFVDYNINPGKYDQFSQSQPKEVFTNFMINSQKEIDIYLKNNYIETDDGVLIQEVTTSRIVNYDSFREMDFRKVHNDFLYIDFKITQKDVFYTRTYRKIQEILAQIGGFINCFWIIAFSINYMHSNLVIISEIIMNIFTIKFLNNKNATFMKASSNLKISSKKNFSHQLTEKVEEGKNSLNNDDQIRKNAQSLKKVVTTNNDLIRNEKTNSKVAKMKFLAADDETLNKYSELNLSLLDYVYFYTGIFKNPEREKKKIIIQEGGKILQNCLDIKYIISKFYEIEKLKQILLSKEEIKQFSNLPKPEIKINLAESKNNRNPVITTLLGRDVKTLQKEKISALSKLNRNNT